jgi:hypothetical protein
MPYWTALSDTRFGTYVEYLARLEFVRLGADIYLPEVDDKGLDFIVRFPGPVYLEVQVKGRRQLNYFYISKEKFPMEEDRVLFLGLFLDKKKEEGDYFLIPASAWKAPNKLFRDYPYDGKKSAPEWGLSFTPKTMPLLEPYRFHDSLKKLTAALKLGSSATPHPAPQSSPLSAARGKISFHSDLTRPTLPDNGWKPSL